MHIRLCSWTPALALAALSGLFAPGCSNSRAASAVTDGRPTVAVAQATMVDLTRTLTLAAEFRPFQEIDVHAKVAGYLKTILVDVGDQVKQGQLLAVLEIPELRDEAQEDEAAVQRSAEEINRAQADLERAESAHEVAHLAATRLAGVLKSRPNLVAQQDVDDAAARDRMAEAQVATAKAALAAARQQLAVSNAVAHKTKTLLEYTNITAPFTGVVTHRYADTGAMIQAGTASQSQAMPVIRLSQNARLRLTIAVPESAVASVRVGQSVEVHVDTIARTMPGTISRVSGKVRADTRTMDAEVDVKNDDLSLVPGMYASASIALERPRHALTVPIQALEHGEEQTTVLVAANGVLERRPVKVGLETPDRAEITDGIHESELVVVGNRSQLRPGMAVNAKVDAGASTPRTE
jgi:RND family efflux transporter MFP subunit